MDSSDNKANASSIQNLNILSTNNEKLSEEHQLILHINSKLRPYRDYKKEPQTMPEFESLLKMPDSVMDKKAIPYIKKYAIQVAKSKGQRIDSQTVMACLEVGQQMIINQYRGYPKMCNLLLDWMRHLNTGHIHDIDTQIKETFIKILKSSCQELYIPNEKQRKGRNLHQMEEDYNENGIRIMFDTDSYVNSTIDDILFSASAAVQSTKNKTQQKKRRLMNINHTSFLLNVTEFEHRLLRTHLRKILQSQKEIEYQKKCEKLCSFLMKNELYFVYFLRLIEMLRESNLHTFLDLCLSAIEDKILMVCFARNNTNHNISIAKLAELVLFAKGIWNFGENEKSNLRLPGLELLKKGAFTLPDLDKVYDYFVKHPITKLRFLQTSRMMQYLFRIIFIPTSNLDKKYVKQYVYLFARCVTECQSCESDTISDIRRAEKCMEMVTEISSICRSKEYGILLSESLEMQNILFDNLLHPEIAKGILLWITYSMIEQNRTYFSETFEPYVTQLFVCLISKIAIAHPFLRKSVASFAGSIIQTANSLSALRNMRLMKVMLDLLVLLIQCGNEILHVFIFNLVNDLISNLDRSLCRHFLRQIICSIFLVENCDLSDEYCVVFINDLLFSKLIVNSNVIAAIKNELNMKNIFQQFIRIPDVISCLSVQSQSICQQIFE